MLIIEEKHKAVKRLEEVEGLHLQTPKRTECCNSYSTSLISIIAEMLSIKPLLSQTTTI